MTISNDGVKPSPKPDSWTLRERFATAIMLGGYLSLVTVIFFWAMKETSFFSDKFNVRDIHNSPYELLTALHLQAGIVNLVLLIYVIHLRCWSDVKHPVMLLMYFVIAQLSETLIAVYGWEFASVKGIGWGWAGVICVYGNVVVYIPLVIITFAIRYMLRGRVEKLDTIEQHYYTLISNTEV